MCTVADLQTSTTTRKSSPSLQRGKACLSCRRRKMKCDGIRPVCTPCLRGDRVEDCEYTDGLRRPRTLTLEDDIARLKARVQELENPDEVTPSVQLLAPYAAAAEPSAVTSDGTNPPVPMSQAQTPTPSAGSFHHVTSAIHARLHAPPNGDPLELNRTESEIHFHSIRALSAILPYRAEIGFFLDTDRLRVQGAHILPALQSALMLWSVHITSISKSDHGQVCEGTKTLAANLLSQTQTRLASALSTVDTEPDPAIYLHIVQTGILLAYYMQRIGQVVGARYYASGTWTLGMMLKLHQGPLLLTGAGEGSRVSRGGAVRETLTAGNMNALTFAACAKWAQPLDGIETEERVRAFWAVYTLDRWFGAVCEGCRPSSATDNISGNAITVPWPSAGSTNQLIPNNVQHFLNGPNHDFRQDGVAAMLAKASVLLGEATVIVASYLSDHAISQSPVFRARFGTLDALLQQCLTAVMTMPTDSNEVLVTVHIIALAHVTLHRPFLSMYERSGKRCVQGALGVVRILDRIGGVGLGMGGYSPIYAIVWTALCLTLHAEVLRLRAQRDVDPSCRRVEIEMTEAIRRLVGVLSAISQRCPSKFFAANIEAVLPVLESIAI